MVLTPHAVFGSAFASALRLSPPLAFIAGFLSHFLLDIFPHWDYRLKSAYRDEDNYLNNDIVIGRDFYFDLTKISFDAFLGLSLSLLLFSFGVGVSFWTIVCGAIGGILPDALQFLYMKIRREPLTSLQRIHILMHAKKEIENPVVGVFLHATFISFCLFLGAWTFFIW